MRAYNLALIVHVVGALALGAANAVQLAGLIAMRRATTLELLRLGLHLARRAARLTPLSALLLLTPAIYDLTMERWQGRLYRLVQQREQDGRRVAVAGLSAPRRG